MSLAENDVSWRNVMLGSRQNLLRCLSNSQRLAPRIRSVVLVSRWFGVQESANRTDMVYHAKP